MDLENLLGQFDWSKLAYFIFFALPGFISLQIWALIVPTSEKPFKDSIPDALGFGILNAMVGGPLVVVLAPNNPWYFYALLILTLVVLPATWPFLTKWCLGKLFEYDVILNQSRNGWDALFKRREPLFVIVHLSDGRRIGGFFGAVSFAGLYPASGHLYLEQLWNLNAKGHFVDPIPGSRGIVLRPEDYHFIELLAVPEEANDDRQQQAE